MHTADHVSDMLHSKDAAWSAAIAALHRKASVVLLAPKRAVLMFSASTADMRQMATLIRYSSGFVQTALPDVVCDRLQLPESMPDRRYSGAAANGQCVAVDAASGVTTGISATDRARTARMLSHPDSTAADFTRPGHVVPVRVIPNSPETTSNAVPAWALALTTAAGMAPGAVYADLVSRKDATQMASFDEGVEFARAHDFAVVITEPFRCPIS